MLLAGAAGAGASVAADGWMDPLKKFRSGPVAGSIEMIHPSIHHHGDTDWTKLDWTGQTAPQQARARGEKRIRPGRRAAAAGRALGGNGPEQSNQTGTIANWVVIRGQMVDALRIFPLPTADVRCQVNKSRCRGGVNVKMDEWMVRMRRADR